jgi:hypothetical protein
MNWRWNMDYGGGQLMDWVGHHLDIAHWGLGLDLTGPVEITGKGEFPTASIYNSATRYWVETLYADGTPMVLAGGYPEIQSGTKWIGDLGWIWVDRGGFESQPAGLVTRSSGRASRLSAAAITAELPDSVAVAADHRPGGGHRSASVGHPGVIAIERPDKKWDPAPGHDRRPGAEAPALAVLSQTVQLPA